MAVLSVAPVAIAPFEPQECVTPELFCVLSIEVIPAPGEAEAVTVEVVGAGEVMLNPEGNAQVARDDPQTGLGVGDALLTVSVSLALFPVSSVPIRRWVVVLV